MKCKACGGQGKIQTKDGKKLVCIDCRGTGEVPSTQKTLVK